MLKDWSRIVVVVTALLAAFLCKDILAGTTGVKDVAGNSMAANYTTASLCKAKSIIADPKELKLSRAGNGDVTITVKGNGNCLVEGVKVTATVNNNGGAWIAVTPRSQKTDANGEAVFAIVAGVASGTSRVKFKASGLSKSAIVQVTVGDVGE